MGDGNLQSLLHSIGTLGHAHTRAYSSNCGLGLELRSRPYGIQLLNHYATGRPGSSDLEGMAPLVMGLEEGVRDET